MVSVSQYRGERTGRAARSEAGGGRIATWSELDGGEPTHVRSEGVDLVVIRDEEEVSGFERRNLTTWKNDVADLTGVEHAGVECAGVEYAGFEYAGVEYAGVGQNQ